MKYFLSYNSDIGKFEEITRQQVSKFDIVLLLDTDKQQAIIHYSANVGMIARRTAQRMLDSITRSGYDHSKTGRIGYQFEMIIQKNFDMSELTGELFTKSENEIEEDIEPTTRTHQIERIHKDDVSDLSETKRDTSTQQDTLEQEIADDQLEEKEQIIKTEKPDYDISEKSVVDTNSEQSMKGLFKQKINYTIKIPLFGNLVDTLQVVNTILDQNTTKDYTSTIGMEPYSEYDMIGDIRVCYNIVRFSPYTRFKESRLTYLKGSMGFMLYYNPDQPSSIEDGLELCNEIVHISPDVKIAIIKCGEGDLDIRDYVLPTKNIMGFYHIENEKDTKQKVIIRELTKSYFDL